jgi:hypothetical protein
MARKISVQNEFLDSVGPRIKEDILKQETITLEGQCLDTVCDKKKKNFGTSYQSSTDRYRYCRTKRIFVKLRHHLVKNTGI